MQDACATHLRDLLPHWIAPDNQMLRLKRGQCLDSASQAKVGIMSSLNIVNGREVLSSEVRDRVLFNKKHTSPYKFLQKHEVVNKAL